MGRRNEALTQCLDLGFHGSRRFAADALFPCGNIFVMKFAQPL
jgi:hypothetical protein